MKIINEGFILDVTPKLVAELFCSLNSEKQAEFYNHMDEISREWLPFQFQSITDEDGLTLAGRRVMQQIGNYSHWGLSDFAENGLGMRKQK